MHQMEVGMCLNSSTHGQTDMTPSWKPLRSYLKRQLSLYGMCLYLCVCMCTHTGGFK